MVDAKRAALAEADAACELARQARRAAETSAEAARREAAKIGAELARANQFLRSAAGPSGGARSLSDDLEVEAGAELALSAALGARLSAAVVEDRAAGGALLDRAKRDGGRALSQVRSCLPDRAQPALPARAPSKVRILLPPQPLRRSRRAPFTDLIRGPEPALSLARRLLADAWLVEQLDDVPDSFTGVAVTPAGRAWLGATRELQQAAEGGAERVLAMRNQRDALIAQSELHVQAEHEAGKGVEAASQAVAAADALTRRGRARASRRRALLRRGQGVRAPDRVADGGAPQGARAGRGRRAPRAARRRADLRAPRRRAGRQGAGRAHPAHRPPRSPARARHRARPGRRPRRRRAGHRPRGGHGADARDGGRAGRRPCRGRGRRRRAARLRRVRGRDPAAAGGAQRARHARRGPRPAAARPGGRGGAGADRAGREARAAGRAARGAAGARGGLAAAPARRAPDQAPRAARPGQPAGQAGVRRGRRPRRRAGAPAHRPGDRAA